MDHTVSEMHMTEFETHANGRGMASGQLTDDVVERVGAAAAKVAVIQDSYAATIQTEPAVAARDALATQARMEAEQAIDEQGISVDDYNAVLTAAEHDPDLESRLVDAARRSL
jgi:hypothetical protein